MLGKLITALAVLAVFAPAATAAPASGGLSGTRLAEGLEGASGSTVGPGGALYVTEGAAGRISRVDPATGAVRTFASGLPKSVIGIGGAIDVAFVGRTAYVLVTLVGEDVGGSDRVGIYRVDGPRRFTRIADIGAFSMRNPPRTEFEVPTGTQYALERFRDGFLVTDAHHNRVLHVGRNGTVTEVRAFDNVAPTGLAVSGNRVYMAEAGPIPYWPEDGKVVVFRPESPAVTEVASGLGLLVDVEFGRGRHLYALSQGLDAGGPPGTPAQRDTGSLARVNRNGGFTVVAQGLDRPTSVEIIRDTAYVVTLGGEILKLDRVSRRRCGRGRH